jgi:hypothetical protein
MGLDCMHWWYVKGLRRSVLAFPFGGHCDVLLGFGYLLTVLFIQHISWVSYWLFFGIVSSLRYNFAKYVDQWFSALLSTYNKMVTKQWKYGINVLKNAQNLSIYSVSSPCLWFQNIMIIICKLLLMDSCFKHCYHYSSLFLKLAIFVPDPVNFVKDPGVIHFTSLQNVCSYYWWYHLNS